jgi:hypothetical protein
MQLIEITIIWKQNQYNSEFHKMKFQFDKEWIDCKWLSGLTMLHWKCQGVKKAQNQLTEKTTISQQKH